MDERPMAGYYLQYVALGLAAAIIFSANLSELMNAISFLIFIICVFFICILIIYSIGTHTLRPRKKEEYYTLDKDFSYPEEPKMAMLDQSGRYVPQERYLGKEAQATLRNKSVAIIGLGRTGTAVSELLCRAGVGNLSLIEPKIEGADHFGHTIEESLRKANSAIRVQAHLVNLHEENQVLLDSDLVIDCTDNFDTKLLINAHCIKRGLPWIMCTVEGDHGYIKAFHKKECLACMGDAFEKSKGPASSPIAAMFGSSIVAIEAIKSLTGRPFSDQLIAFNVGRMRIEKTAIKKDKSCSVCNTLIN